MATANAGRAAMGVSQAPAFRAPLRRNRLAVSGQGRGEQEPEARAQLLRSDARSQI